MKIALVLPAFALAFLTSVYAANVKWEDLALNVEKALETKEAHYSVAMIAKSKDEVSSLTMEGELILETTSEDGKAVLKDSMIAMGRTVQAVYTTDKTTYLYPTSITSRMIRQGKVKQEITAAVADGKITFERKGKTVSADFPAKTLTLTGLMRFMPQLPREAGTVIALSAFTGNFEIRVEASTEENPISLVYQGLVEIEIQDVKTEAHTYELQNLRRGLTFYVSNDDRLIQLRAGDHTIMTLMTAEQVKEMATTRVIREKEQAEEMAKTKADINEVSWRGWTEDAKKLLTEDPTLANKEDKNGNYPLHGAATFGRDDVVKLLITFKADVNRQNRFGNTPLHETVSFEKVSTAKLLIAAGADRSLKNNFGKTALERAKEKKKHKMVDYLTSLPVE